MASYTGTSGNDSWTVINPGTFSLDGLGGTDTLYLGTSLRSSYTITRSSDGAVHVDSVSGASAALHATLTNMEKLVFSSGRDTLDLTTYFGGGSTAITGTSGNDTLSVGAGTHTVDGLAGIDTAQLAQPLSAYALSKGSTGFVLAARDGSGSDTLFNVERLQFSDAKLALDLDGHAGEAARILGAVFGAAAVANQSYVGIGLHYLDGGMGYEALCELAVSAAGLTSHDDIVTRLWTNVVGSAPTAADKAPYVAMLDGGTSVGALTAMAADTALNASHIDLVGLAQHGLGFA